MRYFFPPLWQILTIYFIIWLFSKWQDSPGGPLPPNHQASLFENSKNQCLDDRTNIKKILPSRHSNSGQLLVSDTRYPPLLNTLYARIARYKSWILSYSQSTYLNKYEIKFYCRNFHSGKKPRQVTVNAALSFSNSQQNNGLYSNGHILHNAIEQQPYLAALQESPYLYLSLLPYLTLLMPLLPFPLFIARLVYQ